MSTPGPVSLTPQERRVLHEIAYGRSRKVIVLGPEIGACADAFVLSIDAVLSDDGPSASFSCVKETRS